MNTPTRARISPVVAPASSVRERSPVNWRSVALGLAGGCSICAATPFNNYVLNNTDLIGNHLPAGLLMLLLAVVLPANAALLRWFPRAALQRGEMAVALGLMLVACSLPSVGLMRYLPGHLVAFFAHSSTSDDCAQLMREMNLPDWIFPDFASRDPALRGNEPVVRDFFNRVVADQPGLTAHLRAIPWGAWARPLLAWGAFAMALFGMVLCMATLFHRQWVENERLPFPLASVYLSLIEPPEPGRAFNALFHSRAFWLAFGAVFVVHGIGALHLYFPRNCPDLPLGFDLRSLAADPPLAYLDGNVFRQRIYFTIIGITYFVQTKIALSIWVFFLVTQVIDAASVASGGMGTSAGMATDQRFGTLVAFGAAVLWVGRSHLWMVLRQMVRGPAPGEPRGRFLPFSAAGWGCVGCAVALVIWLSLAGASLAGALVIVGMLMLTYLTLARVLAETGLLYLGLYVPMGRPWIYLANCMPSWLTTRTTMPSYFFGNFFSSALTIDVRQAPAGFVPHALRIFEQADPHESTRSGANSARRFVVALVLAYAVCFVVAGASTLLANYSFASSLDRAGESPIGSTGSFNQPRFVTLDTTLAYRPPRAGAVETHNRLGHFALGAGITAVLSALRLRFEAWPFHPIGFLLCRSWGVRMMWFSVFVGWLAKSLLLRFGGATVFSSARPIFLGILLGETTAVGFWAIFSALRALLGLDFQPIQLLPV